MTYFSIYLLWRGWDHNWLCSKVSLVFIWQYTGKIKPKSGHKHVSQSQYYTLCAKSLHVIIVHGNIFWFSTIFFMVFFLQTWRDMLTFCLTWNSALILNHHLSQIAYFSSLRSQREPINGTQTIQYYWALIFLKFYNYCI